IRGWPQLRDWVSEDRESLRAERRIAESARDWISANRDASALYTGRKLIQALQWSEGRGTELPTDIQEFLAARVGMRHREIRSLAKGGGSFLAIVFIVRVLTTWALSAVQLLASIEDRLNSIVRRVDAINKLITREFVQKPNRDSQIPLDEWLRSRAVSD